MTFSWHRSKITHVTACVGEGGVLLALWMGIGNSCQVLLGQKENYRWAHWFLFFCSQHYRTKLKTETERDDVGYKMPPNNWLQNSVSLWCKQLHGQQGAGNPDDEETSTCLYTSTASWTDCILRTGSIKLGIWHWETLGEDLSVCTRGVERLGVVLDKWM